LSLLILLSFALVNITRKNSATGYLPVPLWIHPQEQVHSLTSIMVVMEYKLSLADDFRIGDTIMITNKTSTGWKAMINNKREIVFEANKETSIPLLIDGWMLVDVNDRWEKMWACCKENPFQVGFFKSEQDKIEKIKKNESLYLENLNKIEELEVVQATNPQNPPVRFSFRTQSKTYNLIIPVKDGMANTARDIMKALNNKEKFLSKPAPAPAPAPSQSITKPMQIPQQQSSSQSLSRSAPQTSPIHSHFQKKEQPQHENHHQYNAHNFHPVPILNKKEDHQTTLFQSPPQSHATPCPPTSQPQIVNNGNAQNNAPTQSYTPATNIQNQLATQLLLEKKVQIQAPPPTTTGGGRSSPGPGQSQIGGAKWLANIKNMVNPAKSGASALNVAKTKENKAQSVNLNKSLSLNDIPSHTRNTQNVGLAIRSPASTPRAQDSPKERKILTRVYWRDGTYTTVDVSPGITAKEICLFCTKKTKVALFENLFVLYECFPDGTERMLDPKSNVSELLLTWGEDSENHLVCDLNLGTKNTVKTQLRKTLAMSNRDDDSYDSESDIDANDFNGLDDLDTEPSEEDESIAKMIQEMIKLKHQLQEEDEMIERLNVEEQEVDMLISRLANL
jgi:hypothetical protein